jgi:cobalt/nickel transport system permease protein
MEQRPVASLFRALDPRTLLLAAAGAAVCFSLIHTTALTIACLVLSLLLVLVSNPPLLPFLKRLALANVFILFLWVTVPFTVPGESVLRVGPLCVSREGLALAFSVTLKCNAIVLCFLVFLTDLSVSRIGYALERLRVPAKLVFLFLFTCRYIHVIGEEWRKLQTAAVLRGVTPRTSLHTYGTIGNMHGLTHVNSLDRSARIYEAMLLRGFTGVFHTVTEWNATRRDFFFGVFFFSILICLLTTDIFLRLRNA